MFPGEHFVIFIQSSQYSSVLSARSKTIWVSVIRCWVRTVTMQERSFFANLRQARANEDRQLRDQLLRLSTADRCMKGCVMLEGPH